MALKVDKYIIIFSRRTLHWVFRIITKTLASIFKSKSRAGHQQLLSFVLERYL